MIKMNNRIIFIGAAGMSAALPGVIKSYAEHSPVIGVALPVGPLAGKDAVYSIISMPKGVAVSFAGIGEAGLYNAALMACELVALYDMKVRQTLWDFKVKKAESKPSKWIYMTNKK